jgi:hypothetical protein
MRQQLIDDELSAGAGCEVRACGHGAVLRAADERGGGL